MTSESENTLQAPCKTFKKKKSLACYQLTFNNVQNSFDHYELCRIVNPKAGEYYLLPIDVIQKHGNHHLSYHKSGAFHWRTDEWGKIYLKDGEADYRSSFLIKQAMSYLSNNLDGYCLSVGRKVDPKALKSMLLIMDGYILSSIDPNIAAQTLIERKNFMIPLPETEQRITANKIVKEAIDNGKATSFSQDEIVEKMKAQFGENCKIINLEPKKEKFISFPIEVTTHLFDLARDLCKNKMMTKSDGFWTDSINITSCNID